jgi:hypothetical protein
LQRPPRPAQGYGGHRRGELDVGGAMQRRPKISANSTSDGRPYPTSATSAPIHRVEGQDDEVEADGHEDETEGHVAGEREDRAQEHVCHRVRGQEAAGGRCMMPLGGRPGGLFLVLWHGEWPRSRVTRAGSRLATVATKPDASGGGDAAETLLQTVTWRSSSRWPGGSPSATSILPTSCSKI